jgi:IclR family pca regulon transcriptional regulator
MEALVARVNESSSISVLDDTEVVYVVRVPTRRIMTITIAVGTRLPAYATSMGRVLLAGLEPEDLEARLSRIKPEALTSRTVTDKGKFREILDTVRRQGYAMVDQELEDGLRSAAVPIHDASGRTVAALNVSVHASRATLQTLKRDFLPLAIVTAQAIDADLRSAGTRAVVTH